MLKSITGNLGEENKNLKKEREEMIKSLADLRGTLRRKQRDAGELKCFAS